MSRLEEWLKECGLDECWPTLARNHIDFDLLPGLTESDLEKLGLSLGHRRKLLQAIAALKPAAILTPSERSPSTPHARVAGQEAERRQVTVLICDLVGSTELAGSLDPEDMGTLIRRFQDACSGAIARFDGFVAKFMGDSVLAYFGYPLAHEDAVGQSVRAALAIVENLTQAKRPDGKPLQARVGIATGLVVIGDIIGDGVAREHAIVGETPNLAARLQAQAEPNAILVAQTTHQLLGRQFECRSLGQHALKGFARPVPVWRVLREAAVESRFAATRASTDGAFVGRGKESALLLDRWRLAKEGAGQVVLVQGEAGIGKSRLLDTVFERVGGDPCVRVTCQCSPYHTNSALYPVIRHLERASGFAPEDTDTIKLGKLETMLSGPNGGSGMPSAALIADLLSLPTDRYAKLELSAPQRKAATIAALVDLLTRLAEDAPVLLLLEDAHWMDPTTKEVWTRLIDSIASIRLLALITARPEFSSPWTGRGHLSSVELTRLTRPQSAELVAGIAAPQVLALALVDDIVGKTDGIPLFVEELTKAVLESSTPDRPSVPATLQDSLMARLDRLGPAKEIAQIAAVIGQQFSQALLAAVVSYSAAELTAGLLRLIEAGLVYRRGRSTESSYSFKHALLRDVAYENLLRARRQQLHSQIGQAMLANFSALAKSEPELLAYHFSQAGLFDLACTYRERAGDRAVARSSFTEAVAHFTAALADAAQLAEGPDRTHRKLGLLLKSGPALTAIKGYHSPEVGEVYQRAHDHSVALGDEPGLFKATWGLWINAVAGRRLDLARDRAEALVLLAGKSGDDDLLLEGFHCRWSTGVFRGEPATIDENSREGIKRYDREKHSWMGPVFGGHDPGVCACTAGAIGLSLRGRYPEARDLVEKAISLAKELKHPNSLAHAWMNGSLVAHLAGDHPTVNRHVQQLAELADKYNLPPPRAHAVFLSGWELAFGEDLGAGTAVMEAEFARASALSPFFRYYAALLAQAREKVGRVSDALAVLQDAIDTIAEPGIGLYISELYRLQGICLLRDGASSTDEAMRSLQTAVDIARQQGATLLELRAAVSVAKATVKPGWPTPDLRPLRAVCADLPPEFESPDLDEAKRLLAG